MRHQEMRDSTMTVFLVLILHLPFLVSVPAVVQKIVDFLSEFLRLYTVEGLNGE